MFASLLISGTEEECWTWRDKRGCSTLLTSPTPWASSLWNTQVSTPGADAPGTFSVSKPGKSSALHEGICVLHTLRGSSWTGTSPKVLQPINS